MNAIKKVLAADTSQGLKTIHNILGNSVELMMTQSLLAALDRLPMADVIICGIHFDESRMFDLLSYVRARPEYDSTPFIVYRDLEYALDTTLFKSMEVATKALGANDFIDLFMLKQNYGIEEADCRFRAHVLQQLT